MKIGRFGGLPPTGKLERTTGVSRPDKTGEKDFAAVLEATGTESAQDISPARAATRPSSILPQEKIRELSEALRAGSLTRKEFAEEVVREVVRRVPNIPESAQVALADRLLERLQQDPTLRSKLDTIERLARE